MRGLTDPPRTGLSSRNRGSRTDLDKRKRSQATQRATAGRRAAEDLTRTLSLLRATLDSTADGILVVNREGHIEIFNRKFAEMWRIPDEVLAAHDDKQALDFVLQQLDDPQLFIAKVRELYSQPEAESSDILKFKDGRVFERYSRPQWIGGEIVGRVWSFRDVTAGARAEEALRREHSFVRLLQAVAVAANEARTVEDAFLHCLDRVCTHTGWPVGHVYLAGEDVTGDLVPTKLWHLDDPARHEAFRQVTEATRLPPGVGLPGRVLKTHKPAWMIDARNDPNFPRARAAHDVGLRAGFAFPVMVGTEVVAVLEFFAPDPVPPDEALLDVMIHVGTQLGRVIERKRAGDRSSRA